PASLRRRSLRGKILNSPPNCSISRKKWLPVSKKKTASSRAAETDNLAAGVRALRNGDVIAYPTETLYGLGADALNPAAVDKILQLKGRDARNPIPVLVADCAMLAELVTEIPPLAKP